MNRKSKKILVLILCLTLLAGLLWGCSSESKYPDKESTRDQLAEDFYTAYYLTDLDKISGCCPYELEGYLLRGASNADYGSFVKSISVELTEPRKGAANDLQRTEKEYLHETGVEILISEGYYYSAEITMYSNDGDIEKDDARFEVIVAKIDGEWYAFPANL